MMWTPDEPRCKVWSKSYPGSIILVPSTEDHDPANLVRVLYHNMSRHEWERLTGMSINPTRGTRTSTYPGSFQGCFVMAADTTMIFHAVQLMDRERSWGP